MGDMGDKGTVLLSPISSVTDSRGNTIGDKGTVLPSPISSVTDSRGNTTSYTYNADGSVNTATDAKGNKLIYIYNENGSVRLVRDEDELYEIYYSYHKNSSRVSRILGNTVDYRITYDNYGRKTKIQNYTGSTPVLFSLIVYKDNYSSLISHIEYGNGTEIVRFYDNYDRLESEWIDSQLAKTYTYDSYNRVLSYTDISQV